MIDFDRVAERLFVGVCPTTPADAEQLKQAGMTAILNLQTDQDFDHHGINWPQLTQAYRRLNLTLHRLPIIDFDKADLVARLPDAARLLADTLACGHLTYLHCTAGKERSPAVAVAYLAWHRQLGLAHAVRQVRTMRDCKPYTDALARADQLYGQAESRRIPPSPVTPPHPGDD